MMDHDPRFEPYLRRDERDRKARKNAESVLEGKRRERYSQDQEIKRLLADMEQRVAERTAELQLALQKADAAS